MTQLLEPRARRWTKDEFYRMEELGFFTGQRAELVGGEIVVLSPQKFLHASMTDRATELLRHVFTPGFWVRMQLPLDTGQFSLPEPDVSVVIGAREDYRNHPTSAALVVEISDTTLAYDRGAKAGDYAAAAIADYWIINLVRPQLEVHRQPVADANAQSGWRYDQVTILTQGQFTVPLAKPDVRIEVADLVPRRV